MKIFLFILIAIAFAACTQNNAGKTETTSTNTTVKNVDTVVPDSVGIIGSFVGPFGDNKITILITKNSNDSIQGTSIVGGNDRPFVGTYTITNAVYKIIAKEPGDNKYDGIFTMTLDNTKPTALSGTWKPYQQNAHEGQKVFSLQRLSFTYNPTVGQFTEASTRLLKEADVENLSKLELQDIRNTIFARHGYCFKKPEFRQQFETEPWYIPNTTDVTKYLTELEKKNISLIKKYEKYADEFGDDFGR